VNERIVEAEQDVGSTPTISTVKVGELVRYCELSENPRNGKLALIISKIGGPVPVNGYNYFYYKILIDGELDWVAGQYLYKLMEE
jgi:hypothetical protein